MENAPQRSDAPRVLVVKLSSLGDLLHALPAVHALRRGLAARIDWVTHEAYRELVQCFDDVDRVLVWHRQAGPRQRLADLRALRTETYDWIIDLQGILKSALVTRLARGRRRIGPSFHREASHWFYNAVAGVRHKERHAIAESLDISAYLHLPSQAPVFPMTFPLQLVSEPRPRVALVPCTRWPSKNWPLASFVELGRLLQEQLNAALFLLGGAADAAACEALARDLPAPLVNLAGRCSLPQLGGILREMDLVISNDSGPMHLAAALSIPVLAIFGPTDPVRTGPYGTGHRVLQTALECQPCFRRQCTFGDTGCLRALTPAMVFSAAREMLLSARALGDEPAP